ncbi:hypothetical protein H2O73_03910 [Vibrio sp. 404]|uniref:DUF4468 domain-containing protein n=1 Tax=Vibrio marinisediminis TaxID=2758441 RepID=A0A7W2ISG4_9VIBR|nr:hypothetical protein [Vibrio marinisediminis]MBA5761481.1 hypothetical protein [Vibrio marinisediminis]
MKWITSIMALLIAPVSAAQQETDILGVKLQMTPNEVIQFVGVGEHSKVTVGNINNPTPTDFEQEAEKIAVQYEQQFNDADANELDKLIEQVKTLRLSNQIKEISCSEKACDTPFMKKHNIIWFIARFSDDGVLGSLSIRQNVTSLTADTQDKLEKKYQPEEVWGDISEHRSASLNRLSKYDENLTIKLKNYSSEKLIEYKLYNDSLFDNVAKKEQRLVDEFKKSL